MKDEFLPPHGPTPHSSFLSMAIAMGAMSVEEAVATADQYPMERTELEKLFDRGCTAAQFARYDEAVTVFTDVLAKEPKNWPALYNRALAYLHLSRLDEARAGFEDYARHEPNQARASSSLAHLFLLTRQIREAQDAARHALKLEPNSRAAAANLGHSLIYTIRRADAEEAYLRTVPAEARDAERAAMIDRLRQDAEEFRRAGWPEEKLRELVLLVRQIELNPSGRKAKPRATDGSEGFIGANIDKLRHGSDFFTWFHLEPAGQAEVDVTGITSEFKPSGAAFRDHVTLRVRTDAGGTIEEIWLEIERKFIEDPKEGIFACDLAKSFLRHASSPEDSSTVHALAAEIESNAGSSQPIIATREHQKPLPLSPAGKVFFGRGKAWETALANRRLKLSHAKGGERLEIGLTV